MVFFNHVTVKFQVGTEKGNSTILHVSLQAVHVVILTSSIVVNMIVVSWRKSKNVFNTVLDDTLPIVMHFPKSKRTRGLSLASVCCSHWIDGKTGMSYLFVDDLYKWVLYFFSSKALWQSRGVLWDHWLSIYLLLLNCIREDTRIGLVSVVQSILLARDHFCVNDWLKDSIIRWVPSSEMEVDLKK